MTDTPTGDTPTGDEPADDEPADDQAAEGQTADASAPEAQAPGTGPDVPADEPIAISATIGTVAHKPVKDRLLLPLLVPILSAIAVGVLAINISRVFLAGDSQAALFVAIFVTLAILGGASLLASAPHMHTSSLAMVVGLILVIVTGAGLLTLGPSLGHDEGGPGCEAPTAAPVGTLEVEARPNITFNAANYDAPAGVVDLKYFGAPGHTLAFREPNVLCVDLATPGPPSDEAVDLKPGETYNIYCTIPGHDVTMHATVTVAAS